jgi:hypothetical protein
MAGVDPRSAGFDRPLTPARVASVRLRLDGLRIHRVVMHRLRARPGLKDLADAFELAIRRLETREVAESLSEHSRYRQAAQRVAAAADLLDDEAGATRRTVVVTKVPLVRGVDLPGGRHVYALHPQPGAQLGSLEAFRQQRSVSVWLDAAGRLASDRHTPPGRVRPSSAERIRFLLAPLAWKGRFGAIRRLRTARRRLSLLRRVAATPQPRFAGEPVASGYLHPDEGPGRHPLYAAYHPVTGDQLLTNSPLEAADMGYGPAQLIGYVTGDPAVAERPELPWASRLGQRVRPLMQTPGTS